MRRSQNILETKEFEGRRTRFATHTLCRRAGLKELYIPSHTFAKLDHFEFYGLTDLSIMEAIRGELLLLTADSRLSDYLGRAGLAVADFRILKRELH